MKPAKVYRAPDEVERQALAKLRIRWLRCRPVPTARRSRTPRSTSPARSSATRTMPSKAREGGPGVLGRLLPDDLPGADRPGTRAALRLVRRTLWHRRDPRSDRQGAGRRARSLNDQFVAAGGGPKIPILACARLFLGHHIRAAGNSARPAVRHQPSPDILLAETAAGNEELTVGLRRHQARERPAPQPQADRRARAHTAWPFASVEFAALLRDRRFRFRRSLSCSPSPRIRPRRWQSDDKGWCRPNRPA